MLHDVGTAATIEQVNRKMVWQTAAIAAIAALSCNVSRLPSYLPLTPEGKSSASAPLVLCERPASGAGLSRANVVVLVVLFVGKCMLPGDPYLSLQRLTAGRLPRRYRLASLPLLPSVRTPLSRQPPSRQK